MTSHPLTTDVGHAGTAIRRLESSVIHYIHHLLAHPLPAGAEEEGSEDENFDFLPSTRMDRFGDKEGMWWDDDWLWEDDLYLPDDIPMGEEVAHVPPPEPRPRMGRRRDRERLAGLRETLKWIQGWRHHEPEPIVGSTDRLRHLLSADLGWHLRKMARLAGAKECREIFDEHPLDFLVLLELSVLFNAFDDELIAVSRKLLGRPAVRKAITSRRAGFQGDLIAYLRMVCELIPSDRFVRCWGFRWLGEFRRAVTRDMGTGKLRSINALFSEVHRLDDFITHTVGAHAENLIGYFGRAFSAKYLMSDAANGPVTTLVGLGAPFWVYILTEGIGVETFKKLIRSDIPRLNRILGCVCRSDELPAIVRLIGTRRVKALIRAGIENTRTLKALAALIALRPQRIDLPECIGALDPQIVQALERDTECPDVIEAVNKIAFGVEPMPGADALSPDRWMKATQRLLNSVRLLVTSGYPAMPPLLAPIISYHSRTPPTKGLFSRYERLRSAFSDIRSLKPGDIPDDPEQRAVAEALIYGTISRIAGGNLQFHSFQAAVSSALSRIKQGERLEDLPVYARPCEFDVAETVYSNSAQPDLGRLKKVRETLSGVSTPAALAAMWRQACLICREIGFRFAPDVISKISGHLSRGELDGLAETGMRAVAGRLLRSANPRMVEMLAKLLLGHLLIRNRELAASIFSDDPKRATEALYELFFDRPGDALPHLVNPLAGALTEWLLESGFGADSSLIRALEAAKSLREITAAIGAESGAPAERPSREQMAKIFPLTSALCSRYRSLIERECAKIRPLASRRKIHLRFQPGRDFIDLASGVYGEDCTSCHRGAERLFHPGHVFYRIYAGDSETPRGYLSLLEVRYGRKRALLFDVINPSSSLNVSPEEFLRLTIGAIAQTAATTGFVGIGIPAHWPYVSNRQSIVEAAQVLFGQAPVVKGFQPLPGEAHFQSGHGDLRLVWARENMK